MAEQILAAGVVTTIVILILHGIAYTFGHPIISFQYSKARAVALFLLHCAMVTLAAIVSNIQEHDFYQGLWALAQVEAVIFSGFYFGIKWIHSMNITATTRLSPSEVQLVRSKMSKVIITHVSIVSLLVILGGTVLILCHLGAVFVGLFFGFWAGDDDNAFLTKLSDGYLKNYREAMGV